jgi:hypothetical protein
MYSLPQIVPSNMVLDLPTSMYHLPKIHVTENIGNGSNEVSKLYFVDQIALVLMVLSLLGYWFFMIKNGATQFFLTFFFTIDSPLKD